MTLSGKNLAAVILASCTLSTAIAAWSTSLWFDKNEKARAELIRHTQIELRCLSYWNNRSAIADATFEFEHGRDGLVQTVRAYDPVLETWIPGLRTGLVADVREDFPLLGPKLDDLIQKSDWPLNPPSCSPSQYVWDYNVTMLRLSGRGHDVELQNVSPEFSSRR